MPPPAPLQALQATSQQPQAAALAAAGVAASAIAAAVAAIVAAPANAAQQGGAAAAMAAAAATGANAATTAAAADIAAKTSSSAATTWRNSPAFLYWEVITPCSELASPLARRACASGQAAKALEVPTELSTNNRKRAAAYASAWQVAHSRSRAHLV